MQSLQSTNVVSIIIETQTSASATVTEQAFTTQTVVGTAPPSLSTGSTTNSNGTTGSISPPITPFSSSGATVGARGVAAVAAGLVGLLVWVM